MRRNIITVSTIGLCLTTILLLSLYFFRVPEPLPNSKAIESIFTLPVEDFKPEPNERKLFIIAVLLTPILCGIFHLFLNKFGLLFTKRVKFYTQMVLIATPALLYLLVYYSMKNTIFPFLALSSFNLRPLLTFFSMIVLLGVLIGSYQLDKQYSSTTRIFSILYYAIGFSLIGLVALETIHNDTEPTIFVRNSFEHLHFTAYFDAIAQTYLGKSPITLNPQYGYYPFFLNPIFQVIGLTIFNFSLVMSLLKFIAYSGLLLTLRHITNHWLIALTGFSAMLFYTRIRVPLDINLEPYFQYNPHRLFFPALLVFLVWLYVSRKSGAARNAIYVLTTLAASISVLWNPDTGIIVFASWLIVLAYIELVEWGKRSLKQVLQKVLTYAIVNFSVLGFVILIVYAQFYLQNRKWPDLIQNFQYTSLFYNYGFYMLTLPRKIHPWMWIILSYIMGIYLSISHLLDIHKVGKVLRHYDRCANVRAILTFTISIIGIGIFAYYQGRSHNYNLVAISWPAYLLFTIFTDQLLNHLMRILSRTTTITTKFLLLSRYTHQVIFFIILFYFLGSSLTSIAIHLPGYANLISTRLAGSHQTNSSLQEQAQFISETSAHDDNVLLLTDEATELYLYTNHQRPLDIPGFSEFVLRKDAHKLQEFLRHADQKTKIYWDRSFQIASPEGLSNLTPTLSSANLILFEAVDK